MTLQVWLDCSPNVDRQRSNFAANFDIRDKARQAEEALMQQTSIGFRTRSFLLVNCLSVSRQDESRKWEMADMWEFVYRSSLSTVGTMDIRALYFLQFSHKSARVSTHYLNEPFQSWMPLQAEEPPAVKVVTRHRDLALCPMSSIALMFWERFVKQAEPFPRLGHSRKKWSASFAQTCHCVILI